MADNYVFLKNLGGEVINPRTELGAIDMTTVNGIVVSSNTIGIMDGYIESSYYMNMVSGTDAANQDSAYIDGGTMFQLIGGYTVTDEIPPITGASHERVPSEYSVRSAIDALATLGPSLAPGAGIVVETIPGSTGGTIAVAGGDGIEVNTAQQGGVSVKAATSGGLSVTSAGVAVNTGSGLEIDGSDNVSVVAKAGGGLAVDTTGVGIVAGDTLDLTGGTVNAKVAAVDEVLTSLVTGSTVQDDVEEVTPGNLRGALSVGQAVDVSCVPTRVTFYTGTLPSDFITPFTLSGTNTGTNTYVYIGWDSFPKFAPNLKYLMVANITNNGGASVEFAVTNYSGAVMTMISSENTIAPGETKRIAATFSTEKALLNFYLNIGASYNLTFVNWRQYEVTALTDEAIAYIAQLPDPDDFFRSTAVVSVLGKYLVKQDMVCPWIYTIGMPDNSDLTVAAGLSYKIKYTNDSTHKITVDTIPADAYGWDTHIQMFVKGTAAVQFQSPLVLMQPLTANAGHNLIIKYRNGNALVYVDDLDAGYVVTATSGTSAGSLYVGLTGSTNDYVVFGIETNGSTCTSDPASITETTNLIGNGLSETTISADMTIASGKYVAAQDLKIAGSTVNGSGSLQLEKVELAGLTTDVPTTLSDTVNLVDGSTVNGSGHITFNNGIVVSGSGVFDLEDSGYITEGGSMVVTGATFSNGTGAHYVTSAGTANERRNAYGGVFGLVSSKTVTGTFTDCVFDNNVTSDTTRGAGGIVFLDGGSNDLTFTGCTFTNNACSEDGALLYMSPATPSTVRFVDCIITGNTSLSDSLVYATTSNQSLSFTNCTITGNTCWRANLFNGPCDVAIENCDITGNTGGTLMWPQGGFVVTIRNSKLGAGGLYVTGSASLILGGTVSLVGQTYIQLEGATTGANCTVESNTVIDLTEHTGTDRVFWRGTYSVTIGNNVQFIDRDGTTILVDACQCGSVDDSPLKFLDYVRLIGNEGVCRIYNATFRDKIDASAVTKLVLKDVTFTNAGECTAVTRQPGSIRLTGATVSYPTPSYRDWSSDVLRAPVIVVGDDPTNPTGSVEYIGPGTTSATLTGIGTYVLVNGTNDFVANNTTNVVPVDGSTDGAKYLGTVLSATTGDTGANRFAKIDSGAVAVVNEATNAVNKQIITHDYEPILGGTFSLTSATVNEATKTTTILSGGTMSVVDIRGGNDSVIDLGGTARFSLDANATAYISGVTVANGSGTSGGAIRTKTNSIVNAFGCTFVGNVGSDNGGVCLGYNSASVNMTSCICSGNRSVQNGGAVFADTGATVNIVGGSISGNSAFTGGGIAVYSGGVANVTDSVISGNIVTSSAYGVDVRLWKNGTLNVTSSVIGRVYADGAITFTGSGAIELISGTSGSVAITSGATIDLTGNQNETPIAPGGAVTINCSGTKIVTDTRTVTIDGTGSIYCLQINSDGTIVVDNGHRSISPGLTFTNASFSATDSKTFYLSSAGTITFVNCEFSNTCCYTTTSNGQTGCDIIVSGTLKTNMFRTFYPNTGDYTTCLGTVTIADGCIITANLGTSVNAVMQQIATLIVGTGVKVNGNTVTAGTYTNVTLNKDGTITQVG